MNWNLADNVAHMLSLPVFAQLFFVLMLVSVVAMAAFFAVVAVQDRRAVAAREASFQSFSANLEKYRAENRDFDFDALDDVDFDFDAI